jgi:two-component system CheB/CheR fusion protein
MTQPSQANERFRVLVVDDDRDTVEALTKLLTMAGHDVQAAGSYGEAMAVAAASPVPFDVLLCDLGLPDRSGHELLRDLRARHCVRGIAISGFNSPQDVDASIAAGFREHLAKPFSVDLVLSALQRCCAGAPVSSDPTSKAVRAPAS